MCVGAVVHIVARLQMGCGVYTAPRAVKTREEGEALRRPIITQCHPLPSCMLDARHTHRAVRP
jgi:hypothetical protein